MKLKLDLHLFFPIYHYQIKVGIQRCVRKWILDAGIVCEELDKCIIMEKYQVCNASPGGLTKPALTNGRPSLKSRNVTKIIESGDWTSRTEVVLELIQSKKSLKSKTKLILPLFKLLKV